MIVDSTFLVDLERESRRGVPAGATAFLETHLREPLAVTFTIAGELAAGETLGSNREAWRRLLRGFRLYGYSEDVGWQFGALYRILRRGGTMIGSNDLWIASAALAHGEAVVTRNTQDFSRVPGLVVYGY